ncbi:MAG: tetratricopeptide repeat protein [Magnetococcus sp. WYHC-3]
MKLQNERAQLLMQQNRGDLAITELLAALAQEPEDPITHHLLGACLLDQEKIDEALPHIRKTIELAPEWAPAYHLMAIAHAKKNETKAAFEAIRIAIQKDPTDADNHTFLGRLLLDNSKAEEALAAFEKALSIAPEDIEALNLRGMAMAKMRKCDDAIEVVKSSLAKDPDNDLTHANMGWLQLRKGNYSSALDHFRESLRINPEQAWAREGLVEALKARNPIYGFILRYFLWIGTFSPRAQIMIMVGIYVFSRVINSVMKTVPDYQWVGSTIMICYAIFAFSTWMASPFFNLILLLNKHGRYALSRSKFGEAVAFGAGLVISAFVSCLISRTAGGFEYVFLLLASLWLFPFMMIMRSRKGWPRFAMIAYTVVVLGILAWSIAVAPGMISVYVTMCVLATWLSLAIPK